MIANRPSTKDLHGLCRQQPSLSKTPERRTTHVTRNTSSKNHQRLGASTEDNGARSPLLPVDSEPPELAPVPLPVWRGPSSSAEANVRFDWLSGIYSTCNLQDSFKEKRHRLLRWRQSQAEDAMHALANLKLQSRGKALRADERDLLRRSIDTQYIWALTIDRTSTDKSSRLTLVYRYNQNPLGECDDGSFVKIGRDEKLERIPPVEVNILGDYQVLTTLQASEASLDRVFERSESSSDTQSCEEKTWPMPAVSCYQPASNGQNQNPHAIQSSRQVELHPDDSQFLQQSQNWRDASSFVPRSDAAAGNLFPMEVSHPNSLPPSDNTPSPPSDLDPSTMVLQNHDAIRRSNEPYLKHSVMPFFNSLDGPAQTGFLNHMQNYRDVQRNSNFSAATQGQMDREAMIAQQREMGKTPRSPRRRGGRTGSGSGGRGRKGRERSPPFQSRGSSIQVRNGHRESSPTSNEPHTHDSHSSFARPDNHYRSANNSQNGSYPPPSEHTQSRIVLAQRVRHVARDRAAEVSHGQFHVQHQHGAGFVAPHGQATGSGNSQSIAIANQPWASNEIQRLDLRNRHWRGSRAIGRPPGL